MEIISAMIALAYLVVWLMEAIIHITIVIPYRMVKYLVDRIADSDAPVWEALHLLFTPVRYAAIAFFAAVLMGSAIKTVDMYKSGYRPPIVKVIDALKPSHKPNTNRTLQANACQASPLRFLA